MMLLETKAQALAWLAPLSVGLCWKNHGYKGAPRELGSPWDRMAPRLADWRLEPMQLGVGDIASGRLLTTAVLGAGDDCAA